MFFTMMGQGIAVQAKNKEKTQTWISCLPSCRITVLKKLKTAFAKQFENMDGQLDAIGGEKGSTIINARNGEKPWKFYPERLLQAKRRSGSSTLGTLGDMESRLQKDFQFARNAERWIMARDLKKLRKG
ncbi:MAG: hypothetical protein U0894_19870 [Pirellulales bacterium]